MIIIYKKWHSLVATLRCLNTTRLPMISRGNGVHMLRLVDSIQPPTKYFRSPKQIMRHASHNSYLQLRTFMWPRQWSRFEDRVRKLHRFSHLYEDCTVFHIYIYIVLVLACSMHVFCTISSGLARITRSKSSADRQTSYFRWRSLPFGIRKVTL